jgi:catechol 2,3-dioxygenase-like lactoylglutathione lyase family enzyme
MRAIFAIALAIAVAAGPARLDQTQARYELSGVQTTCGAMTSGDSEVAMVKDSPDRGTVPSRKAERSAVAESGAVASRDAFRIKSIDHTGFTVSSLDDALAFWVGVLGFKPLYVWTFEKGHFIEEMVGVPGAAMRLAMVEGPGHLIELLEYTSPDDRKTYKPRSSDVGSVHLAFYVENIDALIARIASAGWQPVGEIQTVESGERKGLRLIYVRGPDGITLEFLQLPDTGPN